MRGRERRQGGDGKDRERGGGWGGREDRWAARHSTWTTPFRLRDSLSLRMVPVDGWGRLADLIAPRAARDLAHSPSPSFTDGSGRARESGADSRRSSPEGCHLGGCPPGAGGDGTRPSDHQPRDQRHAERGLRSQGDPLSHAPREHGGAGSCWNRRLCPGQQPRDGLGRLGTSGNRRYPEIRRHPHRRGRWGTAPRPGTRRPGGRTGREGAPLRLLHQGQWGFVWWPPSTGEGTGAMPSRSHIGASPVASSRRRASISSTAIPPIIPWGWRSTRDTSSYMDAGIS